MSLRDTIRRLDAEHARGLLTADELEARKAALFDPIPEGTLHPPADTTAEAPPSFLSFAVIALLALATLTAVAALLLGDLALALTLCITLAAALTVRALRKLDP